MKLLTNAKRIIAFVLTLTLLVILPIQTAAAAEDGGYYVSEVFVAYGKNADAAK